MKIKDQIQELAELAEALYEYIDAIPDDLADQFPAMPGHDRDWGEETLGSVKSLLKSMEAGKEETEPSEYFQCACGSITDDNTRGCYDCGCDLSPVVIRNLKRVKEFEYKLMKVKNIKKDYYVDVETGEEFKHV